MHQPRQEASVLTGNEEISMLDTASLGIVGEDIRDGDEEHRSYTSVNTVEEER